MGLDSRQKGVRYDTAAVYDPPSRKSPNKKQSRPLPTRFPDEDHSYQPVRRIQVAKLQQNSLPLASPVINDRNVRVKRQRLANLTDSALWGFPVLYSPSDELAEDWDATAKQEAARAAEERMRLIELEQKEQEEERAALLTRQDYVLYLYLASKYGALDAILYCSTPFPGRLFALLVDQSARRLQKWSSGRMRALRSYWVAELARNVTQSSIENGTAMILRAFDNQRRAGVFLNRLRWRYAANAFRSWYHFTQRQAEVRWRFQFAMQEDLRARFYRWRSRIQEIKAFKKQLKHVARKKQMQCAFAQWQEWQTRQQKLRVHVQTQWTKLQRTCLAGWKCFTHQAKQERAAAVRIQNMWRVHSARKRFELCRRGAVAIERTVRGFFGRRKANEIRSRLEIARCIEALKRVIEWEAVSFELSVLREMAVEREVDRATRESEHVKSAEQHAVQLVHRELEKVRKNDTHQRLQTKIRLLHDESVTVNGVRTLEAVTEHATRMLLDETVAASRATAMAEFLAQVDGSGRHINRPDVVRGLCVVCSAALLNLPETLSDIAWVSDSPSFVRPPCSHEPPPTNPYGLTPHYTPTLDSLRAHDAMVRSQLLHAVLPPHVLWPTLLPGLQ